MTTTQVAATPTFVDGLAAKRNEIALAHREQRLTQLVRLIDELSGEMGSSGFRDAVRQKGYDIDACMATLSRRGICTN